MRARDIVGRKIVGLRQQMRRDTSSGAPAVELLAIDLDNGRHIYFHVTEQEDAADYIVGGGISSEKAAPDKPTGILADDEPDFHATGEDLAEKDWIFRAWWDNRPATLDVSGRRKEK